MADHGLAKRCYIYSQPALATQQFTSYSTGIDEFAINNKYSLITAVNRFNSFPRRGDPAFKNLRYEQIPRHNTPTVLRV